MAAVIRKALCAGFGCLIGGVLAVAGAEPNLTPSLTTEQRQELEKQIAAKEKEALTAETAENLDQARTARQALLEMRTRLHGIGDWRVTDARLALIQLDRVAMLDEAQRSQMREAWTLYQRAEAFHKQGKYGEALPMLQRSLALRQKVYGEEHPDTAVSVNEVAYVLHAQSRYVEADVLFARALTIRRKILGEQHPQTANSYNNWAMNLQAQAKYTEAEPLLRKALAIQQQTLGAGHVGTVPGYLNLGNNLRAQGKFAEGEPLNRKALAICQAELGENHPTTATAYHNVANALGGQGKSVAAEELYRKSLGIRRIVLGETHPATAVSCDSLALNLHSQGRFAEAEPLARKGLAIRSKVLGEEHPDTATSFNTVGFILAAQGRNAEAETFYRNALLIRQKTLGEDHPDTATSYNNVATILDIQRNYPEAERLYLKALTIIEKVHGEEHRVTAMCCLNVGFILQAQKKYGEAERTYRRALAIFRKTLGEEHPHTAACYNNLAATLADQGKYVDAEASYRKALAIKQQSLGNEHPETAFSALNLAHNLHAQGQYRQATDIARSAALTFEKARGRVAFTGLDRASYTTEHTPLRLLAVLTARTEPPAAAWRWLEESLARGLLDDLSARRGRSLTLAEHQGDDELRGRLDLLQKQLDALAAIPRLTTEQFQSRTAIIREYNQLQGEWAQFQGKLEQAHGPAAGQVYELARIQKQLPANCGLLAWVDLWSPGPSADPRGDHWACLVRSTGPPVWVQMSGSGPNGAWTADDLELLKRLCNMLRQNPDDRPAWQSVARRIAAQRLAPLEAHMRGGPDRPAVTHLIVLPSGSVAGIPIEVLTDRYSVSYAPSGTIFAFLAEQQRSAEQGRSRAAAQLLALGDPRFTGKSFAPLPGTRREVESLVRLFPEHKLLLDAAASEQNLDSLARSDALKNYRYLHLATHGQADPGRGLRSFLALADDALPDPLAESGPGHKRYSGRLSAADMLSWKLDAELVTLSACETGLGQNQVGEGYVGFAQALFLAGARSLVLSQWKVDDTATALLMQRFYQNLLGKREGLEQPLGKAASLAEAKRWLRALSNIDVQHQLGQLSAGARGRERDANEPVLSGRPYEHPYYWAGFILIGDPGDLSQALPVLAHSVPTASAKLPPGTSRWWVWVAGVALVFALGVFIVTWQWRRRSASGILCVAEAVAAPPASVVVESGGVNQDVKANPPPIERGASTVAGTITFVCEGCGANQRGAASAAGTDHICTACGLILCVPSPVAEAIRVVGESSVGPAPGGSEGQNRP